MTATTEMDADTNHAMSATQKENLLLLTQFDEICVWANLFLISIATKIWRSRDLCLARQLSHSQLAPDGLASVLLAKKPVPTTASQFCFPTS